MRLLIATLPLLALAACNVATDDKNDSVTVQYDENVAEEAAADVAGAAKVAANEVKEAAGEVKDQVEKVDVDVDVKTDGTKADAQAN